MCVDVSLLALVAELDILQGPHNGAETGRGIGREGENAKKMPIPKAPKSLVLLFGRFKKLLFFFFLNLKGLAVFLASHKVLLSPSCLVKENMT